MIARKVFKRSLTSICSRLARSLSRDVRGRKSHTVVVGTRCCRCSCVVYTKLYQDFFITRVLAYDIIKQGRQIKIMIFRINVCCSYLSPQYWSCLEFVPP